MTETPRLRARMRSRLADDVLTTLADALSRALLLEWHEEVEGEPNDEVCEEQEVKKL